MVWKENDLLIQGWNLFTTKNGETYLIDELKHCSLDLVVTAGSVVESGTADGVNFVEKDLRIDWVIYKIQIVILQIWMLMI